MWYVVRKVSFSRSYPLVLFLIYSPDSSSAASTVATECATLMTVDCVRILAESRGSYGQSTTEF